MQQPKQKRWLVTVYLVAQLSVWVNLVYSGTDIVHSYAFLYIPMHPHASHALHYHAFLCIPMNS